MSQQRTLHQNKIEKNSSLRQTQIIKVSNGDLFENRQNNLDYQEKYQQEVNQDQKQIQNKQQARKLNTKEQIQKNRIQNSVEQNNQSQLVNFTEEEEVQTPQEINQKNQQKTNSKNKISSKGTKDTVEKVQEIEKLLRIQQQEIQILKQSQNKEEFKKNTFALSQFIELKIREQYYNNNNEYLDKLFENYLKSINKMQNQKCEQQKEQQLFQRINTNNEIIEKQILNIVQQVQQELNSVNLKFDQNNLQLTSKLNQINQIQEIFQKDLILLKENQQKIQKKPKIQEVQQIRYLLQYLSFSQFTLEQQNQISCKIEENVKDIRIYIDNHLKTLESRIDAEKVNGIQKMNEIQQNIKIELLQVSSKILDQLRLENESFISQLKQTQNDINNLKILIKQSKNKSEIKENQESQKSISNISNQVDLIKINDIPQKNIIITQQRSNQDTNVKFDQLRSQSIKNYINQLYDESSRKRDTTKEYQFYLRKVQSDEELFQYYRVQNTQQQMELRKYCCSFRQVRGDGNCFYSAFGFQYLELLIRFNDKEFDTFKNQILGKFTCQINFQTFHSDQIPNFSDQLIFEFFYRIQSIRQIQDLNQRQIQLEQEFAAHNQENKDIDGCFYGIVIIFFRSLSNYLFLNSEMYFAVSDINNILIWEQEFNSTELIISELAKFLNIHVVLLFFDKNGFKVQEYQSQNQDKITLLIRPGHYNIGIQ
ncbi:unnamed protein product [Paramecium sonneborni]|uniref:OTU domain-containing protein n=1 Tax=Paramecium sonneborni TaxID=65129 RepID=A0A8S1QTK4_9CILI|nr:unnamed protein product [Paramecium sonneborni]